jgi:hypothetical protein
MPEIIDISVSARIQNGPAMAFATSMELNAYDKIEVSIPGTVSGGGSAGNETVQLIPVATNEVKCLVIQATQYGVDLSYEVNGAGTAIVLDSPQCFIGEGAVSSLAGAPPSTLVFTNNLADDVDITILVGRSALA